MLFYYVTIVRCMYVMKFNIFQMFNTKLFDANEIYFMFFSPIFFQPKNANIQGNKNYIHLCDEIIIKKITKGNDMLLYV